ncbi:kinase [Falsibacillus albus]|uniref:Phosphoribulokinase/uridine kinase domain-containing protein n=1 Tax=Falsibacillus albus TaxID=2478915 RepID=A0A3L7JQ29_9BACI|nr:kinase [Falsibacillus albus]RLQ92434.1 hypothetical protein D9X91_19440 [Falsibacillus albus]
MQKIHNELNHIITTIQPEERFILAIDGLSRAGKTTLVTQLSRLLQKEEIGFQVFHIDDHIVDRNKRYGTGFEEWYEYYQLQWDVGWLKSEFFNQLKSAPELTLPFYNTDTHSQVFRSVALPESGLILVEGIFLQRTEWRGMFDKVIFLDCPREKRFDRETEETKQNIIKFENRYWKAEEYYVKTINPAGKADLVVGT